MANLVTARDIIHVLENGCFHRPSGLFSICKACAEDILVFLKRHMEMSWMYEDLTK